jgi:hypothetical protein
MLGIFSSIQPTSRYFEHVSTCRITILLDKKYLRIVTGRIAEEWNDSARTGVANHLELADGPVWITNCIDIE